MYLAAIIEFYYMIHIFLTTVDNTVRHYTLHSFIIIDIIH